MSKIYIFIATLSIIGFAAEGLEFDDFLGNEYINEPDKITEKFKPILLALKDPSASDASFKIEKVKIKLIKDKESDEYTFILQSATNPEEEYSTTFKLDNEFPYDQTLPYGENFMTTYRKDGNKLIQEIKFVSDGEDKIIKKTYEFEEEEVNFTMEFDGNKAESCYKRLRPES